MNKRINAAIGVTTICLLLLTGCTMSGGTNPTYSGSTVVAGTPMISTPDPQPNSNGAMGRANLHGTGVYATQAVDRFSGIKWKFRMDLGGRLTSVPAVANGTVYFASNASYLHAVDTATGQERWKFRTDGVSDAAPAVADNTVYFSNSGNRFYALDSMTGQEKWSIAGNDMQAYGSAVVAGGVVYVGSQSSFNALDGKTGQQIWSAKISERAAGPAAVVNGVVYFGTRSPILQADTYVYALDSATGAEIWKTKIPEGLSDSAAVEDNTVYCGGGISTLYALDAGTGQQKWAHTFDAGAVDSPAVSGGLVYVTVYKALYAFDMRNGHLIWTLQTGAAFQTEPAIAGNNIYFLGDSGELTFGGLQSKELLYAVDAKSGQLKWQLPVALPGNKAPVIDAGTVYVEGENGYLYAIH